MQAKYRRLREAAYEEGRSTFVKLSQDPTFRDLVCLYIAEGYKRNRNRVSIARCAHGVVTLIAEDTMFRARLQGWVDCLQEQWLDSGPAGV